MALTNEVREKIKELTIRMVRHAETDAETQKLALEIKEMSPDPYYLDYIFYPDQDGDLEDVIERALNKVDSYRPIIL